MSLFNDAKEKTKAKSVEKHEVVEIGKAYEPKLARLVEIDQKIAELEAERVIYDGDIRLVAKEQMISLYDKMKSFPGTIKVVSGKMGFQFITSDKYIKIDDETAVSLRKKYGEDIVTEETTYSFNPVLLTKYEKVLDELISTSKKISAEDKKNLIYATKTLAVTKGTVKNLRNSVFSKFNLSQLIEDIKPIFSVKAIKEENNNS